MTQTSNNCFIAMFVVVGFAMLITIGDIISYDNTLYNFKNKTCLVERIEYPTQLPRFDTYYRNSYKENTIDNNNNLWSKCDCGLRCHAMTSCIKIFVSIQNDTSTSREYQIQKNTYVAKNEGGNSCSLYTNYCPSCNTIAYGNSKLERALEIYDEYINKHIPCFHNEGTDIVYLEKHYFDNLMGLVIVLGISLFIIMSLVCYKYETLQKSKTLLCKRKEKAQTLSELEKYNTTNQIIIRTSQTIL